MTSIIFFDVDRTLLYKPRLYEVISQCLGQFGNTVSAESVGKQHRVLSESTIFPSKTTKEFYDGFNSELLNALGVTADQKLIDAIYSHSREIPWTAYEDVAAIKDLPVRKAILSNWDETLSEKLAQLIPVSFDLIISSAGEGIAKPESAFYERAIKGSNVPADQIMYVGDSMRLDIVPATKLGIRAVLIDREGRYPEYGGEHINTLREIPKMLQ